MSGVKAVMWMVRIVDEDEKAQGGEEVDVVMVMVMVMDEIGEGLPIAPRYWAGLHEDSYDDGWMYTT